MSEPTDEAIQPEMARLICTVPMQRRPSIFEVAREAELFPLPVRDWLTMPFTEMGDQSECFPWTKARHTVCRLRWFCTLVTVRSQTQSIGLTPGHFCIDFVQPTAGATQHFAHERLRLTGSFDGPLGDVLEQRLAIKLLPGLHGEIGELTQPRPEDRSDGIPPIGCTGGDVLDRSIDFLISHRSLANEILTSCPITVNAGRDHFFSWRDRM